jgi:hypothetical protein
MWNSRESVYRGRGVQFTITARWETDRTGESMSMTDMFIVLVALLLTTLWRLGSIESRLKKNFPTEKEVDEMIRKGSARL